jgi:acetyl esterase/lipase
MPLDPAVADLLRELEAMGSPLLAGATPETARERFRRLTVGLRQPEHVVEVASTEEIEVDGGAGSLPARVYRPAAAGPLPTLVFFHGGGFVIGDLDTHDNQCRRICREVEVVVLSVAYRLAPEAPWPAAVEDCLAATRWAGMQLDQLGGDPSRLAVGGDSAGGNLAAVTAQVLRGEGGPSLAAQLLIYPGTDFAADPGTYPSRIENANGYLLTEADMLWFADHYAGAAADGRDFRLCPLRGELAGLPPAVVATAEFDPLRDEGDAYAEALKQAGVRVEHHRFPGLIHGFFDLAAISPACDAAVRRTCASLRDVLGSAGRSQARAGGDGGETISPVPGAEPI